MLTRNPNIQHNQNLKKKMKIHSPRMGLDNENIIIAIIIFLSKYYIYFFHSRLYDSFFKETTGQHFVNSS